ncbi:transcription cofactor vestigial-like protein 2b [Neolamprologus brichardi]|uniref:transcription cofactor vestigial-like protein 2b n=1 Tax=Neolamprologus brichardi TaxID=32507 RepID=UPI0003EBC4CB|nr:transcription cofactor vestigial-like protein 2b [Neolamprologus brichardi]
MSCLDVMYPAYGHYAPYAPTAPAFISNFQAATGLNCTSSHCRDFMDTPNGPEGMSGGPGTGGSTSSSASSSSSSSYTPAASRPEEGPKEKQEAPEAEYLTSRCVLFTYYQGDISSVVDEHFSRALSSYMDGEGKRRAPEHQGTGRCDNMIQWGRYLGQRV